MHALFVSLQCYVSLLLLVTANESCYRKPQCDVDPEQMRQAIELIPDPSTHPFNPPPDTSAYRAPAVFEASEDAQILVRVTTSSGPEAGANPLMEYLWPFAKSQALRLFDKCAMRTSHQSGTRHALIHWHEAPDVTLGLQIDMTCELDKSDYPGVTTYTGAGDGPEHAPGTSIWDISLK